MRDSVQEEKGGESGAANDKMGGLLVAYLPDQEAVIPRKRNRYCGTVDVNGVAVSDPLEVTSHKSPHLKGIYILQSHQPIGRPLKVLQFWQASLLRYLLITRPEG